MALRALLIDALGTTVRLSPPWKRIDPAAVAGIAPERVRAAFAVEMAHYAAHAHEATDAASLAALRADCAELLSGELARPIAVETMMGAIAFEAFPDAEGALRELRALGMRIVCVSNWDYELPAVIERVGLATGFDGVVSSASVGARKPDPAIFVQALSLAGCAPAEALHVGDTSDDVEGARAAGIAVLRIERDGTGGDLHSLAELPDLLAARLASGAISEHSAR